MRARTVLAGLVMLANVFYPGPAAAVDGVIEINQTRALAGGITPGDTPDLPVTISQPGSYRLTSDLEATTTRAITITASEVAIDLNGFTVRCTLRGCNLQSGIAVESPAIGTTIHDGTIQGFGGSGLFLRSHSLVYNMQIRLNGLDGISARGRTIIRNNVIDQNGSNGIQTFESASYVLQNVITDNVSTGLSGSGGTIYTGNLFRDNNSGGSQVNPGSATEVGENFCQTNTVCP